MYLHSYKPARSPQLPFSHPVTKGKYFQKGDNKYATFNLFTAFPPHLYFGLISSFRSSTTLLWGSQSGENWLWGFLLLSPDPWLEQDTRTGKSGPTVTLEPLFTHWCIPPVCTELSSSHELGLRIELSSKPYWQQSLKIFCLHYQHPRISWEFLASSLQLPGFRTLLMTLTSPALLQSFDLFH